VTAWIWDASALHHAGAADRLDVLIACAKGIAQAPSQHLTTATVVDELISNGVWSNCEPYLEVVELGTLEELQAVARWLAVVSSGRRSRGEATVFAWAEIHKGIAIIDDGDARRAARRHGLAVHGTLWIMVRAIEAGTLTPATAEALVNALRATGARFPNFPAGGIRAWAEQHDLLTK
jgi:predicted nucleic acid-binding protein